MWGPSKRSNAAFCVACLILVVASQTTRGDDGDGLETCREKSFFRSDLWRKAAEEYFYLSKLSVTGVGGTKHQHKPLPSWVREDDHVVRNSFHENDDIRSHLPRMFEYTLFLAPETIVELGVRSGWSTRAFSAAARLNGAVMVGIDQDSACKRVYEDALEGVKGFCEVGDSWDMAQNFSEFAAELEVKPTVDLLFIDTSHLYAETVKELAAWAPIMSSRAAIVLHDTNLPPHLSIVRKDGSTGEVWDNERGVARAIEEFVGISFPEEQWFDSGAGALASGWRVMHDPSCCGLTILQRGL